MGTKISFGESLKLLLSTLDINNSRLSKAINVDSSLIHHWIHGKRIPPYNTSHINNIAEYLSKNIYNSYQKKFIDELYNEIIGDNNESELNYKYKIQKILLETQGISIENKKKAKKNNKNTNSSIELSNNDKIIFGLDNIISAGNSLIHSASKQKGKSDSVIYITLGDIDFSAIPEKHIKSLEKNLIIALYNNWHVKFLIAINNDINKALNFLLFIITLIETGQVSVYCFDKYDPITTQKIIYIVSGIGAISCLQTEPHSIINSGFYFENEAAINIMKNHIEVLLKTQAHSLVKYYTKEKYFEYYNSIYDTVVKIGNQFNYNCTINMLLIPESLYERLLIKNHFTTDDIKLSLQYYRKRMNAFFKNIQDNEYREVIFYKSMENLIRCKSLYLYTYIDVKKIELEPNDIICIIQNIIEFIGKYNNYQVAIVFEATNNFIKDCKYNFIIKERHGVYINVFETTVKTSEVRLGINEPIVIKAFIEYFNSIWDRISPIYKDKKEIIEYLESSIIILEKEL